MRLPRWVWWLPLGLISVVIALGAFRMGWIAAHMTETDAINTYTARYLDTVPEGRATDCHAEPGGASGHWLVVVCEAPDDGGLHLFHVNRFGGLALYEVTDRRGPVAEGPQA